MINIELVFCTQQLASFSLSGKKRRNRRQASKMNQNHVGFNLSKHFIRVSRLSGYNSQLRQSLKKDGDMKFGDRSEGKNDCE